MDWQGAPRKSQKEGQEDQRILKAPGVSPLGLFPFL